jgi:hypothetical protein
VFHRLCQHRPGTVTRDRFDYVTAISDSWKSQMLSNLVKLRYGDAPVFLDVASVINQYLVEGSAGYSGSWAQNPQVPWHWRDLILFYEYFHGDKGAGSARVTRPDGQDWWRS